MDTLFDIERNLLMALSDRLGRSPPLEPSEVLEQIDSSLLTSAWQKAIRRGDSHLSVRCALELHRRDPDYLWRRMRIIALEDISVGDTELVATVLAIAGTISTVGHCFSERAVGVIPHLSRPTKAGAGKPSATATAVCVTATSMR